MDRFKQIQERTVHWASLPVTQMQQLYTPGQLFHLFSHLFIPSPDYVIMFRHVPDIILFVIVSWHIFLLFKKF